ncbi:hypothetical protein WJX77_009480 [Trebouxia sp. C0004]
MESGSGRIKPVRSNRKRARPPTAPVAAPHASAPAPALDVGPAHQPVRQDMTDADWEAAGPLYDPWRVKRYLYRCSVCNYILRDDTEWTRHKDQRRFPNCRGRPQPQPGPKKPAAPPLTATKHQGDVPALPDKANALLGIDLGITWAQD